MFGFGSKDNTLLSWRKGQHAEARELMCGLKLTSEPTLDMCVTTAPKRFHNRYIIGGKGARGGAQS